MFMEMFSVIILMIGILSLLFTSISLFSVLISFEFLALALFFMISLGVMKESVIEMFLYLVMVVVESLLGLVVLILMVFLKGSDILDLIDVF